MIPLRQIPGFNRFFAVPNGNGGAFAAINGVLAEAEASFRLPICVAISVLAHLLAVVVFFGWHGGGGGGGPPILAKGRSPLTATIAVARPTSREAEPAASPLPAQTVEQTEAKARSAGKDGPTDANGVQGSASGAPGSGFRALAPALEGVLSAMQGSAITSANPDGVPSWIPSSLQDALDGRDPDGLWVPPPSMNGVLLSSWREAGSPSAAVGTRAVFLAWIGKDGRMEHSQAILGDLKSQDAMMGVFAQALYGLEWTAGSVGRSVLKGAESAPSVMVFELSLTRGLGGVEASVKRVSMEAGKRD